MHETFARNRRNYFITRICALLMLTAFGAIQSVYAGGSDGREQTYVSRITGITNTPATQALTVGAEVTLDYGGFPQQGELSKKIKNIITLSVIEESADTIPDFTAVVNLRIEYKKDMYSAMATIDQEFTVDYNKAQGLKYNAKKYLVFDEAQYVKITVLSYTITAPSVSNTDPLRKVLAIDNEMRVVRYYELDNSASVSGLNGQFGPAPADIFKVGWSPCSPETGNNFYQLEWVWVEDELAGNYLTGGNMDQEKLFRRNATRVDIPYTDREYDIPFFYDGKGTLYYRIRPVLLKHTGNRADGPWTYSKSDSHEGHNDNLNWQAGTAFSEEGKRNTVVQYFDGLLRNRQTVSKDNTTNTTIAAETFYDMEGRPAIQVLPAPGANNADNVIQYRQNLNLFNGQNQNEDPSRYFDLQPIATPNSLTPALSTASGTSKYYSPDNPDLNADQMNKSIPDAKGYPYTVTRYTPDGTGRIMSQSGVSENMKLGSGHETKYYYGTAAQEELDGLFGTDAGNFTHYFKSMVKDANGQMSVSYTDMQGRTIATAFAGDAPGALMPLDIKNSALYPGQAGSGITRNLLDNDVNVVKNNNTIESNTTLLVPALTTYNFQYKLTPESLGLTSCSNTPLCFDCMYDLEIIISDESQETPPVVRKFSNVKLVPDDTCVTPTPAFTDLSNNNVSNTISFAQQLQQGSYSVRKTLTMSEATLQFYKDLYVTKGICRTEQQIIDSVRNTLVCHPVELTCQSCLDSLGTPGAYRTEYLTSIGVSDTVHSYDAQITAMYNNELASCNSLCNNISQTLASKREIMLGDMIPYTGQYAKPLDSIPTSSNEAIYLFKKYNIFYELPGAASAIFRKPWNASQALNYYRDDLGAVDESIHPPALATPYDMLDTISEPVFVQMFRTDWAEALLPHHPEYHKLVFSETHLTAANNYINTFLQTDEFSQASSNNYLFKNFTELAQDPFYGLSNTAAYRDSMAKYISQNYRGGYTMWQLAYAAAKCQSAPNQSACLSAVNGAPVPFTNQGQLVVPYVNLLADEKNTLWQVFRGLYGAERENQVNDYIDVNATPHLPAGEDSLLVAKGYILRFPKNNTQIAQQSGWSWAVLNSSGNPNTSGLPANTPTTPAALYQSRCESYIQSWKAQLLQCDALANHPQRDAIISQIMTGMVQVCVQGSDAANPFGSSNVAPSTPNTGAPRSFEEVINQVFAQHGINRDYYCNPYVIEYPKPYGHGPQMYSQVTTAVDSCNCTQFAIIKTAAANAGYNPLNLQSLNIYLHATYGDTITAVMFAGLQHCGEVMQTVCTTTDTLIVYDCGTTPQGACDVIVHYSCEELAELLHEYHADHSHILEDAGHSSIIFTDLFNQHFGTHYSFNEITAIYQCDCDYQLTLFVDCGKLTEIINAYYQATGSETDSDPKACTDRFVEFFNEYFHTSGYSWEEIRAIYKDKCGHNLYLCSDEFNCKDLSNIEHDFSYEGEPGHCTEAFAEYFGEHFGGHYSWNEIVAIYVQVCGHAPRVCGDWYNCDFLTEVEHGFHSEDPRRCRDEFIEYFNAQNGTHYSWEEIVALYIQVCGHAPNVCGSGEDCNKLQDIVDEFVSQYGYTTDDPEACHEQFVNYFNSRRGTSYTWDEIVALYIANCGHAPDVCKCVIHGTVNECHVLYNPYPLTSAQPVPDFLTCNGGSNQHCLSCAQISAHVQAFKLNFAAPYNAAPLSGSTFTDDQIKSHVLFAKFINYRTGFQFNWMDYVQAALAANCNMFTQYSSNQAALQNVICGDSHPVTDTTNVPVDPCQHVNDMATAIGQQIYQNMLQTQMAAFEAQYRAKCMSVKELEQFTVQYTNKEYHYTLYYYDVSGNLVKTVPPKGVKPDFTTAFTNSVKNARIAGTTVLPAHTFATNYRYNSLNQIAAQNTPDAGTSLFWYDQLGRLVVSQNAQQKQESKYSYTLYDNLGRIAEVGQKPQTTVMAQTISQDTTALAGWVLNTGGVREQIINTVYDTAYPALLTANPVIVQENLRNRVSYITTKKLATDAGIVAGSYFTYDIHGNVDSLVQDFAGVPLLNDFGQRFKTITYDYDLISGKVNQVNYQPEKSDAFYHRYHYDAGNRITSVETSRDKIIWDRDAQYNYYKHGLPARTELGQLRVQGMDYAYTLQGWLKGVNSTNLLQTTDIGLDGTYGSTVARDALGFALHYFDTLQNGNTYLDYTSTGGLNTFARRVSALSMKSLFNGNIAAMAVNNAGLQTGSNPAELEAGQPLFYNYRYDQLNRIISMRAYKGLSIANNTWRRPEVLDDYKELASYDPNGNILTYNRNGVSTTGMPLKMDEMTYVYSGSSNKLAQVKDAVPASNYPADIDNQGSGNYKYDAIGNLISDAAEGITNIQWTVYGKIASITKSDGSVISYTYDAAGNRIAKMAGNNVTVYVRDAQGNVMSVYERVASEPCAECRPWGGPTQTEVHLYGSSRLGMITQKQTGVLPIDMPEIGTAGLNTFTRGERVFELTNHLGNVMTTVSDKKTGVDDGTYDAAGVKLNDTPDGQTDYYKSDILSANDYYPFGMQMPGRSFAVNNGYRYGFTGHENDNEVADIGNYVNMGGRMLDTRLGRTSSSDPAFEEYPSISPYAYVMNSPLQAIDPDGKRVYFVGGAGNDPISQGWNYVNRFAKSWTRLGIKGFTRVNATHGKFGDMSFVDRYRNFDYSYTGVKLSLRRISVADDKQLRRAVDGIVADIMKRPLEKGEQLNMAGYSYGAVLQAHATVELIKKGYKVDNLILIASPTMDNSDLMKTLLQYQKEGKLGKIIRKDIPGDDLSNPKSGKQYFNGIKQGGTEGDDAHHFDMARPGAEADKKIEQTGKELKKQGVK